MILNDVPDTTNIHTSYNTQGMYEIYRGPSNTLTMQPLSSGARYTVRVKAINRVGESPFSQPSAYLTQAHLPSAPGVPTMVNASNDAILFQWQPSQGNGADVTGYLVEADDGHGGEFRLMGRTPHPQYGLTGLASGLDYRMRVRAENVEGLSAWSPTCIARTAARPPLAPNAPIKVSSTESSIHITWAAPEYDGGMPIIDYIVEIQPKDGSGGDGNTTTKHAARAAATSLALQRNPADWKVVFKGTATACTVASLRAGCTYRARVKARNECGEGPYSVAMDMSTSPAVPEPPGELSLTQRTQSVLGLKWKPPEHDGGSAVLSYKIEYRPLGQKIEDSSDAEGPQYSIAYEGSDLTVDVKDLIPGTKYEFRAASRNKQGFSAWSPSCTSASCCCCHYHLYAFFLVVHFSHESICIINH